jgi:hypothetical protein
MSLHPSANGPFVLLHRERLNLQSPKCMGSVVWSHEGWNHLYPVVCPELRAGCQRRWRCWLLGRTAVLCGTLWQCWQDCCAAKVHSVHEHQLICDHTGSPHLKAGLPGRAQIRIVGCTDAGSAASAVIITQNRPSSALLLSVAVEQCEQTVHGTARHAVQYSSCGF